MQIAANGLAIEVDDQGPANGEPVLLIMGLGMQLIAWPQRLVQELVRRGFRVLRMDNRDIGLSSGFDHLGPPSIPWAMLHYALRQPVPTAYTLADMALDAVGVLDALGIRRAHVCGASMGGMIAQHLAASHADRVDSLTLIMTTSGARRLPQPGFRVRAALLKRRPDVHQPEALLDHLGQLMTLIGSPGYPAEPAELRSRLRAAVDRAWRPAGSARQLVAIAADGDRTPLLARISAPTHIIHGQADPLVPVAAGRDLLARIAGSTADFIPGMGHDLPAQLLSRLADGIAQVARRAR
jgi:pimeloyl-ACP methyl ester carboxylesterase